MREALLSIKGIVNRFGSQLVHDGVSFDINQGEIIGIVGGSGAGKSVLLRTLIGLRKPEAGSIIYKGQDLCALSIRQTLSVVQHWGVLFQNGALFSGLTVSENIQLPMKEHFTISEATRKELAHIKLRMVGLPDNAAKKFPAELSGGMVKRASLARALALDPEILFLDEPTSGLDPISAAGVDELLLKLQEDLGLTVVMITHDLDSIFRVCERVAVLVDNSIIVGAIDEIVNNPSPWIQSYFHGPRARQLTQKVV